MKDPYEILGLERSATDDDVKKAFRKKASQYHPDKNQGDAEAEQRMKDVIWARDELTGKNGQKDDPSLDDLFNDFDPFSRLRTDDGSFGVEIGLEVEFLDAVKGCERVITIPVIDTCQSCVGRGFRKVVGSSCEKCSGRGKITVRKDNYVFSSTCDKCRGNGGTLENCDSCAGQGKTMRESTVTIRTPPGVRTGGMLRLRGMGGGRGEGHARGDMIIRLNVRGHEKFHVEGNDINSAVKVDFITMILGCQLAVETIDGPRIITVVPNSGDGTQVRLPGLGVRTSPPGDHVCTLKVQLPETLTDHQRSLLETLRAEWNGTSSQVSDKNSEVMSSNE